jgi:hypothetical protein
LLEGLPRARRQLEAQKEKPCRTSTRHAPASLRGVR